MKYLKPLILESKQVGIIYHYTAIKYIFKILKENKLVSERGFLSQGKNYDYISCTRDRDLHLKNPEISSTQVKIKIDGNLLSNNYKIIPRDDNWKRTLNNKLININNDDSSYGDEMEESIITKEINNVSMYIKEITFYFDSKQSDEITLSADLNKYFNVKIYNKESFIEWFNETFPNIIVNIIFDDKYYGIWRD